MLSGGRLDIEVAEVIVEVIVEFIVVVNVNVVILIF
jgi:hypothetical protein